MNWETLCLCKRLKVQLQSGKSFWKVAAPMSKGGAPGKRSPNTIAVLIPKENQKDLVHCFHSNMQLTYLERDKRESH